MKKEAPARDWIRKAENDLLNARNTLSTLGQNCPYDTVCFHGQQAVEKYIKALLSQLSIKISRIHDIDELIELLPREKRPHLSNEEQARLSNYAIAARYPGIHDELTRNDAEDAVRLAEKTKEWIHHQLA